MTLSLLALSSCLAHKAPIEEPDSQVQATPLGSAAYLEIHAPVPIDEPPAVLLESVVGQALVERAVGDYTRILGMWTTGDRFNDWMRGVPPAFSLQGGYYTSIEKVHNAHLRHYLGVATLDDVRTQPWYQDWKQKMREAVREHLKDPNNLRRLYTTHVDTVVAAVKTSTIHDAMKLHLEREVLPTFTHPITPELEDAMLREAQAHQASLVCADTACTEEQWGQIDQNLLITRDQLLRITSSDGITEIRVLQFRQRRYAEGGDALVNEWVSILQDFTSRL